MKCFWLEEQLLQESILTFGKGEFLLFIDLQQMLVFRQLEHELEGFSHTILHQLLLCFLQFHKFLAKVSHRLPPQGSGKTSFKMH
jgi:hypothetical protein